MNEIKLTPAQVQYTEIKKLHQDAILFFRMGDFYEVFHDDAKICSKVLDIALTARHKTSPNPIPMAGVPHHSAEKYISKLIRSGYKVVIAEQTGEVIPGKIVNREVANIVTPGTYLEESEYKKYNFIAALYSNISPNNITQYHLSWGDFSLGDYYTTSFDDVDSMIKFLLKIDLAEIILDLDLSRKSQIEKLLKDNSSTFVSVFNIPSDVNLFLTNILQLQTLSSFGKSLSDGREYSFSLLLNYLKETQKTSLKNINEITYYGDEKRVSLDDITIKNLEIFQSSYEGSKKYSLLGVLDKTNSSMGGRLFRSILMEPIQDIVELNTRFDNIEYYYNNESIRKSIIEKMKLIGDIPRITSLLIYKKNSPFVWLKLKQVFSLIFEVKNTICKDELLRIGQNSVDLNLIGDFYKLVDSAIKDDDFQEDMNYIKDGFDKEIDELRKKAFNSDEILLDYQNHLIHTTGLNSLKIKFVTNQGFFIEVTKKDSEQLESLQVRDDEKLDFMRRQTLKTVERYSTSYLDNIEKTILLSKEKLQKQEKQILMNLVSQLELLSKKIGALAKNIGWLDLYTSFAQLSIEKSYIRPNLIQNNKIEIKGGRHPVIQEFLPKGEHFIANDLSLMESSFLHIITGPNMGGKSTFLRQNALILLMAHCGLWIPAESANICLLDGIFARVGSGDIIAKNQSTFMTEMIEVSNILHNATKRSFVVLDELGRGTSTFDGMALAREIVVYITEKIGAKTLFATHYHELIGLEGTILGVENFSVDVHETDKDVVFLKKIVKGGANKSYGIDVAKLAGLPNEILQKARKYLKRVEDNSTIKQPMMESLFDFSSVNKSNTISQLEKKLQISEEKLESIISKIGNIDVNNITPLQAMQILIELKDDFSE
ncbi:MAG: DNA mismatch repair protein MutS [Candidatus Absconditabacteria bacterium]